MHILGQLLLFCLQVYFWVIIVSVAISWLITFDVINARNPRAANLIRLLEKLTEPVYKPIRKYVPPIGGIDISPIIVIFGIYLAQSLVARMFFTAPVYY